MTSDVLSLEEQLQLVALAQAGDQQALTQLIRAMEGLIRKIAYGFLEQSAGFDVDDLIQEGLLGTCAAIRWFRVERGFHLTTYVADCARRRIWKYLQREQSKPLPQGPKRKVARHSDDWELVSSGSDDDPEETTVQIEKALSDLTPLERQIIELRHGLTELGEYDTKSLSRRLGLRPNRLEELYAKAMERVRRKMKG